MARGMSQDDAFNILMGTKRAPVRAGGTVGRAAIDPRVRSCLMCGVRAHSGDTRCAECGGVLSVCQTLTRRSSRSAVSNVPSERLGMCST